MKLVKQRLMRKKPSNSLRKNLKRLVDRPLKSLLRLRRELRKR
jgi:hypothetical protein